MRLNNAGGMANSADPDQTAPLGAVWSGSALFAQTWLSKNLVTLRHYEDNAKVAVHMGRLKYSLELQHSHATYKHKPNTVRFSSYKTAFSLIFGAHFNSGYQFYDVIIIRGIHIKAHIVHVLLYINISIQLKHSYALSCNKTLQG